MAQSALKPTSSNHFEATYEAPFGGINVSKDPTDIAVNEFVDLNGFITQSGTLTSWGMQNFRTGVATGPPIPQLFPFTPIGDERIISMFNCAGFLCCIDQYLNTYIYSVKGANTGFNQDQVTLATGTYNFVTINTIGSLTLFGTVEEAPTLYLYIPSIVLQVATTFAVGAYVGNILGYAIQVNTNQPSDDPGVNNNRINWSAPFQYATWDPSVNRQAGFDVISDSTEELTGFSGHGSVGYIYRPNGITQATPTGIAILPFDLAPVTQGQAGIGCKYGLTLDQYAGIDFFVGESGVYTFSSAFKSIGEKIWRAMYAQIVNLPVTVLDPNLGLGGITNNTGYQTFFAYPTHPGYYAQKIPAIIGIISRYNSTCLDPKPAYSIVIPTQLNDGRGDYSLTNWFYDLETQSWYKTSIPSVIEFLNGFTITNQIISLQIVANYFTNSLALWDAANSSYIPSIGNYVKETCYIVQVTFFDILIMSNRTITMLLYNNTSAVAYPNFALNLQNQVPCNVVFRQEQTKLGRNVTIVMVLVRAAGFGTIVPTITGVVSQNGSNAAPVPITVVGTQISLQSTSVGTYTSSLVFTGENPQLRLDCASFDGYIVKIMMSETYAEGDLG